MLKFLAKRFLPIIAANLDLDIDTVQKQDGVYLRVRIEAFNFTLLDRVIKVSDEKAVDSPIDVFESSQAARLPENIKSVLNRKSLTDLK